MCSCQAPLATLKNIKELMFFPSALAQTSEAITKISLRHGTVSRDLTRDIRVLEFCLAAPLECFANGLQTRRMVRSYLADRLPADFLSETRPMGVQSGDMMERLAPKWLEIRREMERVFAWPRLARYIDVKKVEAAFSAFDDAPSPRDRRVFTLLGMAYVLGVFLEQQDQRMVLFS